MVCQPYRLGLISSPSAESKIDQRGVEMKNKKSGRGFWTWLMGGGWEGGGGNG
jgi:hypothetical protein